MTVALIIDDQPENIIMLEAYLRRCNIDSIGVTSGREAFSIATSNAPDIVFSDLRMPEHTWNGYKTCEQFRGHPATSHIPFVAVTAIGDEQLASEAGYNYFLPRPFAIIHLKQILSEENLF